MKIKLLLFVFLLNINAFCQFSKTHYIPPVSSSNNTEPQNQYLYISCPSLTPVNYKIIAIGGGVTTGTVTRDVPVVFHIGFGNNTQMIISANDVNSIKNNKGYIVEAEDLVYVSVRMTATPDNFHAGSVVSKGLAALGTKFRIGAFLNLGAPALSTSHYTFAAILATENNTTVSFGDIHAGAVLINDAGSGNTPGSIVLNSGETYVIATQGPNDSNREALVGSFISSDKPIVVNCGSFAGSNSFTNNLDLGFDQIVSAERTGKEYIFIKGNDLSDTEVPLIIADEDNTEVFINGNATPTATINAGEYFAFNGSNFSPDGNLYVSASKNVFAYQAVGGQDNNGAPNPANQNMYFVPPLSCETPKIINNIPYLNQVGNLNNFNGSVSIVTAFGATLDFIIDGNSYTLATLPTIGVQVNGPFPVVGSTSYQTYKFKGLTGNVSVFSSESVYLSYSGSSGAATYGGYYSGFTFKPEVAFNRVNITSDNCIPNVKLAINSLTAFNNFQWYFNGTPIVGATSNEHIPTQPGFYKVKAAILGCGTPIESDEIPVSDCPTNLDGDLANDNIDLDNDNNGISNCTESFGNQDINTAAISGIVPQTTTTYTGAVTFSVPQALVPFVGNPDGSIVTQVRGGKGNYVAYNLNFNQPTSVSLEYVTTASSGDLINADAEYVVNTDINKTITVLNPTNQLLIDTNYDGNYESGVTQFSSFEIRFRLNGNVPLPAGTGTFKFQAFQISNFKITHKNLLNSASNKSTFRLIATCVPNDTDGDGIPNYLDSDDDNDGISDSIEAQSNTPILTSNTDVNLDGMDDAFGTGLTPVDTDTDGIADFVDLDSDNDGILDAVELTVDTDADGIPNYRELDSDNDLCNDVIEAGFQDPNADGYLGNNPVIVNANGQVTSGVGYTAPNSNYTNPAPISITTQPTIAPTCELQNTSITVADNGGNTYQWQVSTDGVLWNNITNNATYSGATTNLLNITSVSNTMNGYKYRVRLDKTGNSCGLISAEATLTVYALPVVNNTNIVQCDDNLDAIIAINLTVNNNFISANSANETFTYYTSLIGAQTATPSLLIPDPLAFVNSSSPGAVTVWTRVTNANGCFRVAQIDVQVIATQIPTTYSQSFRDCDDYLDAANDDTDGITNFDISSVTTDLINNVLPPGNYSIKYYRNTADRDAQTNAIPDITNFRNDIPNSQVIWGRVDNAVSQACWGFARVNLTIDPLPSINLTDQKFFCTNVPSFSLTLDAGINDGASPAIYTYKWFKNDVEITGQTNYSLLVTELANYKVEVRTAFNCMRTRTITLIPSNYATLQEPIVVDLADQNSITINVTGDGDYVYSLDSEFGPFQESNTFNDVSAGVHTAYIKDLNGCGTVPQGISILGVPKFFTPNGDGFNDYWNIQGINSTFNSNAIIFIYDRFGKLLKQIVPTSEGWNGTFNGIALPADDYWFTAQFENNRSVKGHFALKR